MNTILQAEAVSAGYHGIAVVRDLNLEVKAGEIVLLGGANGAGKTTSVMTLAGAMAPIAGTVRFKDTRSGQPTHKLVRSGLGLLIEGRGVVRGLSVTDNLRLAGVAPETAIELFPELEKRLSVSAGLVSGGEQQMLCLARVLGSQPSVIMADELSLGLAPIIVQRLLRALRAAADAGVGVLLVEQHVKSALAFVDRVVILQRGAVVMSGTADELRGDEDRLSGYYL
jgi:branched-chain amino acid transport system ATP-binding protein